MGARANLRIKKFNLNEMRGRDNSLIFSQTDARKRLAYQIIPFSSSDHESISYEKHVKHFWSLNGGPLSGWSSKWTTAQFDPLDRPVQVPIPRLLFSEDVLEDRHLKRTSSFVPLGRSACSKDLPVFVFLGRLLSQKAQSFELVSCSKGPPTFRAIYIRFDTLF